MLFDLNRKKPAPESHLKKEKRDKEYAELQKKVKAERREKNKKLKQEYIARAQKYRKEYQDADRDLICKKRQVAAPFFYFFIKIFTKQKAKAENSFFVP